MLRRESLNFAGQAHPEVADAGLDTSRAVWITWEIQRRTTELSRCLGLELVRLLHGGSRWRRYPRQLWATFTELVRQRPRLLVVQNPSIMLAGWVAFWKPLFGYRLVVDRHTNFMLGKPPSLKKRLFTALSDFTLRRADLTIVTNQFLADLVHERGGRPFVLPDPLPRLEPSGAEVAQGEPFGLLICTYAPDEPYEAVIEAMGKLGAPGRLAITGRPPASFSPAAAAVLAAGDRIRLTGFLPEQDYVDHLAACSFVVALSQAEHCLLCGAYEAVAMGKPMVLSDTQALRGYFGAEHCFVDDTVDGIAAGLERAFAGELASTAEMQAVRDRLSDRWQAQFRDLLSHLTGSPAAAAAGEPAQPGGTA